MTNKSLSQKICEACGIEPKGKLVFEKRNWDKKTWICAGTTYKKFDFESTPDVKVYIVPTIEYDEKNGFEYPYSRIEEIKKLYNDNGYDFIEFEAKFPDFQYNNNNFVKLLNLYFSPRFKSLLHYITSIYCVTNSTDDLLEQRLEVLEFNSENDTVKQIKQAINQADWEC